VIRLIGSVFSSMQCWLTPIVIIHSESLEELT
jgi:hypothetical protein